MSTKALPRIFERKQTINDRIKRYRDGKHQLLTAEMQKTNPLAEETRWVWYSKEQIEVWLEEMTSLGGDGVRIYFGEKEIEPGDESNHMVQKQKSAGQLCLVMVLTKPGDPDINDSHINIIYEDLPDFAVRKAAYDAERAAENSLESRKTKQFNFGSYGPPNTIVEGEDFPNDSVD